MQSKHDVLTVNNLDEPVNYTVTINTSSGVPHANRISTSKYNWWNVIPRLIYEQFSKLANIYFVFIMILQIIPSVSVSMGKPLLAGPLTLVVLINAIKDIFEDNSRKASDKDENTKECLVYDKERKKFVPKISEEIDFGDVVKVLNNQSIPADLILVNTSEQDGIANIETKNLDGETNLKTRQATAELRNHFVTDEDYVRLNGKVLTAPPNEKIYEFDGTIKFSESDEVIVERNGFVLRGCSVRQTEWLVGIVVYCGHDTKIMKNSPSARSKTSRMEDRMNNHIILVFLMQLTFSLIGSIAYSTQVSYHADELDEYIYTEENHFETHIFWFFIERIGTWMLIFSSFVPISLLTTLEMIKYCQALFIKWDVELWNHSINKGVQVQSSGLNEELGQVKYIFSDKTGTLTQNLMEFRKMSIGGVRYGTEEQLKNSNDNYGELTNFNFVDESLREDMKENTKINLYMLCISLCQTVIADLNEDKLSYSASSPDELALVQAARHAGYIFKSRDNNNNITLEINGEDRIFTIRLLFEYSSTRQRMSVIVTDESGHNYLFMKGADSKVITFLKEKNKELDTTNQHLTEFAQEGLRTLLCAWKKVSEIELKEMEQEFFKISVDPSKKNELLSDFYDRNEQNLELLGATAIDDKLQEDVGECLDFFIRTGIKVWVLTGDKVDTAKSIAFSSKLITHEFKLFEFDGKTPVSEQLDAYKEVRNKNEFSKYAIIIAQEQITEISNNLQLADNFFHLAKTCNAVLCCRVSPKQKALLVSLVRERDNDSTTLAIGDGANDVNMITTAHIGIGILGVEGRQAATASDYAIGKFKFLKKLLFVHGREAYRRNAFVICYTFFKNTLFIMPQFWFGVASIFSGQLIYDNYLYQAFNVIFTAFPIIYYGILDQEFETEVLMNDGRYYVAGISNLLFRKRRFWKYIGYGIFNSLVLYIIVLNSNCRPESSTGYSPDIWAFGSMLFTGVVLMANLKIVYQSFSHTAYSVSLLLFSVLSYIICLVLMDLFLMFEVFGSAFLVVRSFKFWLSMLAFLTICVICDYCLKKLLILNGLYESVTETTEKMEHIDAKREIRVDKFNNNHTGAAFSSEEGKVNMCSMKIMRSLSKKLEEKGN